MVPYPTLEEHWSPISPYQQIVSFLFVQAGGYALPLMSQLVPSLQCDVGLMLKEVAEAAICLGTEGRHRVSRGSPVRYWKVRCDLPDGHTLSPHLCVVVQLFYQITPLRTELTLFMKSYI